MVCAMWVHGHSSFEGNIRADQAAKEAAFLSPIPYLHAHLPRIRPQSDSLHCHNLQRISGYSFHYNHVSPNRRPHWHDFRFIKESPPSFLYAVFHSRFLTLPSLTLSTFLHNPPIVSPLSYRKFILT